MRNLSRGFSRGSIVTRRDRRSYEFSAERTMPISLINYGSARRAAGLSVFRGNAKTRRILPIIRRLRNANGIGRPLFSVRAINDLSLGLLISFPYTFLHNLSYRTRIYGGNLIDLSYESLNIRRSERVIR